MGKPATEIHEMLLELNREEGLTNSLTFKCFSRFRDAANSQSSQAQWIAVFRAQARNN